MKEQQNQMTVIFVKFKKFIDENEPVCLDMEPGEFSIHHVNTVHGSGINKGKNYRIGFANLFLLIRHLEEKDDLAMHICGEKMNIAWMKFTKGRFQPGQLTV